MGPVREICATPDVWFVAAQPFVCAWSNASQRPISSIRIRRSGLTIAVLSYNGRMFFGIAPAPA